MTVDVCDSALRRPAPARPSAAPSGSVRSVPVRPVPVRPVPTPSEAGPQIRTPAAEEARRLLERIQALPPGSSERERAREALVRMHLPLCQHLAGRYANRGEPMEDLMQAAVVGLLQAIARFDPSFGTEFSGYAVPTILGELKKHFRDTVWGVHMPRRLQELRLLVTRGAEELTQEHGRAPTVRELAAHLQVDEESVLEGIEASRAYRSASLDTPVNGTEDDGGINLGDTLGGEDPNLAGVDDHEALGPLLAALPERSRRIVLLRFYGNQTQSQIAAQTGVSQMHVSRLLSRALADLRAGMLS